MIPGSMKAIKKDILRHMLTAARTVIARKWRKMADPSIEEWVCEMSELQFLYVRSRSKGTNLKDMATMGGVKNLSNFIKLFVEQYYRAFLLCLPSQLLSYSPALPFSPPFFCSGLGGFELMAVRFEWVWIGLLEWLGSGKWENNRYKHRLIYRIDSYEL